MATFKKKQFRRRKESSSEDEEAEETEEVRAILEETREAQKFRQRQHGVSSASLAIGKKFSKEEEIDNDPFKLRTGGMISLKEIKDRNRDRSDEDSRDVLNMENTFAAETNRRDEDAEMMKYIEIELAKKKGRGGDDESDEGKKKGEKLKTAEDKLYELPDHLKVESKKKSEEMLSNQMLSGIPEVDLGIDSKIANIEATEDAKQQHIEERRSKKKDVTSFVPTNMAVNYVQHARYMHEELNPPKQRVVKVEEPKPRPVVVGDADGPVQTTQSPPRKLKRNNLEKATDDYHYERFKKQLRRY
ncbi:telomere length and silencing protein 1 homolog [Patiria miniata]|uniref:Telomere length and silencing protein 1 homolog n=1 Tax=Patiria miniata TaxID=46514 RepID=A0A914AKI9_PATMI|nr:telomere length and silencing protein 1 homolog [Patiria miniata]